MEPLTAAQWVFAGFTGLWMLAGLALAGLVLAAAPRRRTNQALAFLLLAFVINAPAIALGLFTDDLFLRYNASVYNAAAVVLILAAYLHFVPLAVDAPITRPLRRVTASRAFLATGVLAAILVVVFHEAFFRPTPEGVTRLGRASPWESTALGLAVSLLLNVTLLFSLVAALQAYFRAPAASIAKARAKNYAIAFAVWDAAQIVGNLSPLFRSIPADVVRGVYFPGFFLLFAITLVRALLKYQLFDFDLRLKWTLRRGTVAAIFVGVFFIAAELAEAFLSGALGWVAGAVVAGLLLFALRPIERAATRLADGAMPNVQNTPGYVQFKKLEVYRAAVESALEGDGAITQREKETLARLMTKLAIAPEDALAIEAEVAEKLSSMGPSHGYS